MGTDKLMDVQDELTKEFNGDSRIIGEQVSEFLRLVYPAYLQKNDVELYIDDYSSLHIQSMTFFKLDSCTMDNDDRSLDCMSEKFEKLFTALHSINVSVAYGIISRNGITNLVIGIYQSKDVSLVKTMMQGMLSGVELLPLNIELSELASKRTKGLNIFLWDSNLVEDINQTVQKEDNPLSWKGISRCKSIEKECPHHEFYTNSCNRASKSFQS